MKYIGLCCLLGLLIWACQNPIEDFQLKSKDPLLQSKVDLHFYNPSGALPTTITLTVVGRDAANVVTNLNTKKFKVSKDGLSIVAVSPEIVSSASKPIQFTIVAEAEGFTPVVRQLVFTSKNNQDYWLPIFSKQNPPSGVSANEFPLASTNSGISTTSISTTTNLKKQENASVSLRAGTVLKDANDDLVSGDLRLLVHHFDASTYGFLPTGGVAAYPVDKTGKTLDNPFDFMRLAGSVSVVLSNAKGQLVKTLSQPLTVAMELSASLINPTTGSAIKAGDIIPLASYDVEANRWMIEDDSRVERDAQTGKLVATFSVSHLTYFVAGWRRDICRVGPTFSIKSQLKGVDLVYYCQLQNADNGKVFREYWLSYNNGSSFTVNYVPREVERVKLVAYAYDNVFGGNRTTALATSAIVGLCEAKQLTLDLSALPVPPVISYSLTVTCPAGKTLDEASMPAEFRVQYSEPDKNNWQQLLYLTRSARQASTYKLRVGRRYDLRLSTDGGVTWPYKQLNYLIAKASTSFTMNAEDYCK